MSTDIVYLALLLDAPLQSWGFESRFQRRNTGSYPTKSGIIGLICAAMGLAKGSPREREALPKLVELKMTTIVIPRRLTKPWTNETGELSVRRMEDFHTVLQTRRASGKMNPDPVVTRRQYLLDARFGLIFSGDRALVEQIAAAMQNPVWGVWFGRKSCIPAEPISRGWFSTWAEAQTALIGNVPIERFTTITDVDKFTEGTDTLNDQPVSYGDGTSSGPDQRQFSVRRIAVKPGIRQP